MTIDDAIKHCLEVAEQQEADSFIDRWSDDDEWSESVKDNCRQCAADHRQLAEWLTELKEAKRLLKAAVDDFTAIAEVNAAATPILCPKYYEAYMKAIDVRTRKWRYADEALKLIGGSENGR